MCDCRYRQGARQSARARELCAGIKEGEIVIFDKGYIDFAHLLDLDNRGVNWVTRAKENMNYEVVEPFSLQSHPEILADEIVALKDSKKSAPEVMRRVMARVKVEGEEREMVFLTNQASLEPQYRR